MDTVFPGLTGTVESLTYLTTDGAGPIPLLALGPAVVCTKMVAMVSEKREK